MTLRGAQSDDWVRFYALAADEGWRVPHIERTLLQGAWSHCARVLELDDAFAGLVTAVAHQHSGWIGNLIVPTDLRGRGLGGMLFQDALNVLAEGGVSICWLTASELGRPLYEKSGFVVVDQVERWVSAPPRPQGRAESVADGSLEMLLAADRRAWGESRHALLERLAAQGRVFVCDDAVALLQQGPDMQILGPWYSPNLCPRANRRLLQQVLASADPTLEIVVDLLASSPLRQLLVAAGFSPAGRNLLMARGNHSTADLRMLVALASLGSMG
ncbi:MAG: GNAT family N-acetyltransferase [Desulfuromonadales bacterium]